MMDTLSAIVVIGNTLDEARNWAARYSIGESMQPVCAANNRKHVLRGLRDKTIVFVNTSPSAEEFVHIKGRNHIILTKLP